VALFAYTSNVAEDLTFNKGDVITIIKEDGEWWTGTKDGHTGTFPANYVKKLAPASKVMALETHLFIFQVTLYLPRDAMHKYGRCRHAVSTCLSPLYILSKRINTSSKFFCHRVATPF